jgi:peptidyl-prolyl cis-trans isomerase B (cyclophilin B)
MRNTYKTIGGTPHLDGSYTVFGQCIRGQNIVDTISNVARDKYDRPLENIRIIKIKIKRRWI